MKASFITSMLLGLFAALPALAGQAQFHTARYALAESCQFSCAVGGGVTTQAAKKACQKVQGSAQLFVVRDAKSVIISNTDPRGNGNIFPLQFRPPRRPRRYAFTENVRAVFIKRCDLRRSV